MNIVVCIKRVPNIGETEIAIDKDGRGIKTDKLVYDINETDNYALEEALLLKEKFGGCVTAVTIGDEASNEQLRICMAKGADTAIRLYDSKFAGLDGYVAAKILCSAIRELKPDLVLTGCMASDDAYAQVGIQLGEMLGYPHATLVTHIDIENSLARVRSELENGLGMVLEIEMPAVLAVQTGINEPRYASFRGIRDAMKREIKVIGLADLSLQEVDVGETGSRIRIEKLFIPAVDKTAQILSGSTDETASKLAIILKEKGLI